MANVDNLNIVPMSAQTALNYRTNRDLFSNYHLDEHLPETEAWSEIDEGELQAAYDEIKALWDEQKGTVERRNESQLEEKFIRPMFRKLGIPFEVEESANETQRRPDYGFFETKADATDAFQRREEGGDFYQNAVAVADAKRWGRKLDTRGKKKRDYENPSHQIDQYLRFTSTTWGVLTNGQKWRLYYKPTSHKLDSYYEIDLPTVLQTGNLEEFKYFYLFFRHEAFVPDASGDAFLDDVYEESNLFAQDLGQDLQDNIYHAIVELSEGFLQYPENDLDKDKLELIHDSSLIYLYRIIFVLYAEAEGRDLLDTNNEIYESQYSLNQLKQEVAEELESGDPKYRDWQDNLHSQLDELFTLIDQGSKSRGIPEEDLYIPAYNGGLFRTDPDESRSKEARFLANNTVGDEHLARVIELLTRNESANGAGKIFVDYSSLDVRHLGSIYEGLLEYQLNVADEPLALDDGEYVVADEDSEVVVERDDVYLTTGSGERKSTGSYYTPGYVVEYIVDETLRGPIDEIRQDVVMDEEYQDGGYADEFAKRVFDLRILDPAMGSGHFLTSVVDYLARAIITEQNREANQKGSDVIDDKHDINWARRKVAQRCIYGVDVNPLATELAKVSLWLRTLAAEQPLAFLDHHLKTGNSLIGSDIQDVLIDDEQSKSDEGQLTLEQSFAHTRKQALDHVMDRFSDLLAIDNETLEDAKEMEEVYQSVQQDLLYQKLLAMANVHTASQFGVDVPSDANKRMAEALRGDSWKDIECQDWFRSAQAMADDEHFFHWELEFPVAFYDTDGNRTLDAGFDAVIGNPPYLTLGGKQDIGATKSLKDYMSSVYESAEYKINSYALFYEKGVELLRVGGKNAFIVPRAVLDNHHLKKLRKHLVDETKIVQILTTEYDVFGDAETGRNVIGFVEKTDTMPTEHKIRYLNAKTVNSFINDKFEAGSINQSNITEGSNYAFTYQSSDRKELLTRIQNKWNQLGNYISVNNGVNTGNAADVLISEEEETKSHRKFIEGKDVHPYLIDWHGLWINYDPSLKSRLDPADLDTRQDRVDFSLRSPEIFDNDKIVIRQTSDSLIGAYDSDKFVSKHSTHLLCPKDNLNVSLKFVLAIFNSKFLNYIYQSIIPEDGKTFAEVKAVNVEKLPVPDLANWPSSQQSSLTVEDTTSKVSKYINEGVLPEFTVAKTRPQKEKVHDFLFYLVDEISELTNKRNHYSLSLLDYLSIPSGELPKAKAGEKLEQLQMPVAEITDTPLTKTTSEYDGLRIERVSFEDGDGRLVMSVDISYKVGEDDPRETDRWDRLVQSEFETYEAMSFTDISEEKKKLLREFVPVAVEKGNSFADFRRSAAGTISPLDRLKRLTVPDINEVQTGLERYIQAQDQAKDLEKRIESISQLIDEVVFEIYELTDEDIETIESDGQSG